MKRQPFQPFKVHKDERWIALLLGVLIAALNVLTFVKFGEALFAAKDDCRELMKQVFRISGLDPYPYIFLTKWDIMYTALRHPLLPVFLFPAYLLNQLFIHLFGANAVQVIMAVLQSAAAFYGLLFVQRLLREALLLGRWAAGMLTLMTLGLGYMMVATLVPDHFIFSFFLLSFTLYMAWRWRSSQQQLSPWTWALMTVMTAGVTLTNGAKTALAAFFVEGRKTLKPKFWAVAFVLPLALLLGAAEVQHQKWEVPNQKEMEHKKELRRMAIAQQVAQHVAQQNPNASAEELQHLIDSAVAHHMHRLDSIEQNKVWRKHSGKSIGSKGLAKLTDISTNRWLSLRDNVMGESIQLHDNYLLEDTMISRPVFVDYNYAINYIVELLFVVLLVIGLWCGRRSTLLWLVASWLAADFALHIVLGFGINEVYIMSPHFLFLFTLIIAHAMQPSVHRWLRSGVLAACSLLTLWLWAWNGYWLVHYLWG